MAAGDVTTFNTSRNWLMDGTLTLGSDTVKLALVTSGTTPTASTATPALGDFTEVATGGNYSAGGTTTSNSWIDSSGTSTFSLVQNVSWASATGNPATARWGILYSDNVTATGSIPADAAMAFVDLGATIDMTAGALTVNSGTIFTLTAT